MKCEVNKLRQRHHVWSKWDVVQNSWGEWFNQRTCERCGYTQTKACR